MTLNIKATNITLTPALREYVEKKIGSLDRFLARWEREGAIEVWIEVGRTTRHHVKGDIFRAEVTVRMPGRKVLRADDEGVDVRAAIDKVRDILKTEIQKYKETAEEKKRAQE